MAGMILFSPKGHVVVSMELPPNEPEAKKEQISL